MALNFPHQPDVQLENAPLAEVLCQVRFPPILRIAREEPSEFQERVRHRFPELHIEQAVVLTFPPPVGAGTPAAETSPKMYRFSNAGGQTVISLAADFFAVSTQAYSHWRDFAADLDLAAAAIQAIYAPAYAARIGLRYVNRFTATSTGQNSIGAVFDLLRPELCSLFQTNAWSEPAGFVTQLTLPDDGATLAIRTAYGKADEEPFFMLDFDYFEEGQLPLDGLIERCDRYHRIIYDAFRWSLRDASLRTFKPVAVGS